MLPGIPWLPLVPAGQSSRCRRTPVTRFAVPETTGNVHSAESAGQPLRWSYDRPPGPGRRSTRFPWVCTYSASPVKAQQAPTMVLQSWERPPGIRVSSLWFPATTGYSSPLQRLRGAAVAETRPRGSLPNPVRQLWFPRVRPHSMSYEKAHRPPAMVLQS